MKYGTLVVLYLTLIVSVAPAQSGAEREKQAQEVQTAIEKAVDDDQPKVKGVRFDLRIFEGKIVIFDDDGFSIMSDKEKSSGKLTKPP